MKENMLIETKNISVFRKVLNFFKNIFHKEKAPKQYSQPQAVKQGNSTVDKLREKRLTMELQGKFESNAIKEEDLTEEEKQKLVDLYKEQIHTLESNIRATLREQEYYNQKIIRQRKAKEAQ